MGLLCLPKGWGCRILLFLTSKLRLPDCEQQPLRPLPLLVDEQQGPPLNGKEKEKKQQQ